MSETKTSRGLVWFHALAGDEAQSLLETPASTLAASCLLVDEQCLLLAVVPDPAARFPCARDGQVGLEEAYALAAQVRAATEADGQKPAAQKRPIIAIVDVKSQAYGRREEAAAIFLAAATTADAYATARMAGHPVITLVAGHAFSGGFLTHGYQANRILAFDDDGVVIHAMHKEAAARITMRSVEQLEELAHAVIPMSYSVKDYSKLGLVHKLVHADDPMHPTETEVANVKAALVAAVADARAGSFNLAARLDSGAARTNRKPGIAVRALMQAQWDAHNEAVA